MTFPLISLHQITKRFGYRTILKNIDFNLHSGDCTLLLGNNGAGKTTLLQIICGLMRPSSGQIFFKGKSYRETAPDLRRAIGSISHKSRLYSDLTAEENLKLFGTLYSIKHLSSEIPKVLKSVQLDYAKHLPVHAFSSGMAQRLAIARVMLCCPEILVLDEPYTGLDQNSIHLFQQYLKQYHHNGGTILMVTHQFALGLEFSNRILVIQKNQILHDVLASQTSLEQCSSWLKQN